MKKSKAFYSLYVGIDISKGKADGAILQVFPDRSRKDKMLRKKVRIDFSRSSVDKGKADGAILQVFPDRSRKDKMLRKKVRIDFSRSSVDEFHQTVLKYADKQCSAVIYAMEDTGIYYRGFYSYLTSLLQKKESVLVLKPSYVSHWCELHERSKSTTAVSTVI